jgi:hypothetical protein
MIKRSHPGCVNAASDLSKNESKNHSSLVSISINSTKCKKFPKWFTIIEVAIDIAIPAWFRAGASLPQFTI